MVFRQLSLCDVVSPMAFVIVSWSPEGVVQGRLVKHHRERSSPAVAFVIVSWSEPAYLAGLDLTPFLPRSGRRRGRA